MTYNPSKFSSENKLKREIEDIRRSLRELKSDPTSAGTGTVTSITAGTGLSGGVITESGTIAISDAELLAIAGLTSAADKLPYFTGSGTAGVADFTSTARTLLDDGSTSAMRTTLGLAIGTDVQAYDAELAALAGLTSAADKGIQFTGAGTAATFDLTTAGKALLDDANAAAQIATLGLDADIATFALPASTTISAFGASLIDDSAASNARTTLGLVIGTDVQAYHATLASVAGGTYTGDDSITTVGTLSAGDATAVVSAASDTAAGKVELATTAETTTGTDATRAVTPDGLHDMTSLSGAVWFLDEDNMASDSATKTASQQSIKAYVDAEVAGAGGGDMSTATYDPATIAEQLVGLTATQTLTNKSLTAPKLGSAGFIADANGNEVIKTAATVASAVNELSVTNAAAGSPVILEATGGDTNIHLVARGKGNGLTKISVLRQDNTTNAYKHNSVILTGWGVISSAGTTPTQTETVTMGITFAAAPIVLLTPGGDNTTTDTYGAGGNNIQGLIAGKAYTVTTTTFVAHLAANGNWTIGHKIFYHWLAVGELA